MDPAALRHQNRKGNKSEKMGSHPIQKKMTKSTIILSLERFRDRFNQAVEKDPKRAEERLPAEFSVETVAFCEAAAKFVQTNKKLIGLEELIGCYLNKPQLCGTMKKALCKGTVS